MRQLLKGFLVVFLASLVVGLPEDYMSLARAARPPVAQRNAVVGWQTVPAILARIKVPRFPKRDFKITDYGARSGDANNTDAVRKAIDACHASGGGRVVVPPGVFQTGAIHLKSNVNLHLSEGSTLKFSADPARYLPAVYTRFEGTDV
jgi:polygalacturonase